MQRLKSIAIKLLKDERGFIGALLGAAKAVVPIAGPLLGGLFGKKKKAAPQLPRVEIPSFGSGVLSPDLLGFARKRIAGEGVGFGDDFVSKTTNPVTAARMTRFNEETMPFISSQLSKRGVARSAGGGLATDVIGKAERNVQSDIDQIISQFTLLNEQQKKRDITEGLNLGQNLNTQDLDLRTKQAMADAGINESNLGLQKQHDLENQQSIGTGMMLGSDLGGGVADLLGLALGQGSDRAGQIRTGTQSRSNILGGLDANAASSLSPEAITKLLNQLFGG